MNKEGTIMSLIIGTNAYADVSEYDDLIASRFMSTNPIRVFWDSLSNSDKECLIVGSTAKYDKDSFHYKGYKQNKTQSLQFPRLLSSDDVINCPDNIKLGIVLQGCKDSLMIGTTEGEMIENGVKSFADGTGARIEFATSSDGLAAKTSNGINRDIWMNYFDDYVIKEG